MLAQSAHPQQLAIGRCDEREGQAIGVHVGAKLRETGVERLIAQNVAIVVERRLRERGDKFGMLR